MIDVIYRCDICQQQCTIQQHIDQKVKGISPTKEISLRSLFLCNSCAQAIDQAVVEFKKAYMKEI